jgi:endonuclease/exonuclease/phosphatase family metal-dependent hydrolase
MNFEIFNVIFLLGGFICYRSARFHFRVYTNTPLVHTTGKMGNLGIQLIGLILGIFIPFFTGFVLTFFFADMVVLFIHSSKFPKKIDEKINDRHPRLFKTLFWLGVGIWYGVLFFVSAMFLTGLVGRWLGLDWYYGSTTVLGIIFALFSFRFKKIFQQWLRGEKKWKLSPRTAYAALILTTIVVSTASIISTYYLVNRPLKIDKELYHPARILTFNILNMYSEKFEPANYWENRKNHLAAYLSNTNPDIFGVQEAYYEQLQFLNNSLTNRAYTWSGKGRDDGKLAGEFSAIFFDTAKYDLLNEDTFWLSDTPDVPSRFPQDHNRICSWIHLQVKGTDDSFFIFCTHYGFSIELQIKSSILINNRVASTTHNAPVVVMGDFNLMNFYPAYLYLEAYGEKPLYNAYRLRTGYVNPLEGTSAPTFNIETDSGFHIDHMLVTPDIVPEAVQILKGSYDNQHTYSDHYPVLMECYIPKNI